MEIALLPVMAEIQQNDGLFLAIKNCGEYNNYVFYTIWITRKINSGDWDILCSCCVFIMKAKAKRN